MTIIIIMMIKKFISIYMAFEVMRLDANSSITKAKKGGGVESLSSKHRTLSSNSTTTKRKKEE
jgi:hypothetical protein